MIEQFSNWFINREKRERADVLHHKQKRSTRSSMSSLAESLAKEAIKDTLEGIKAGLLVERESLAAERRLLESQRLRTPLRSPTTTRHALRPRPSIDLAPPAGSLLPASLDMAMAQERFGHATLLGRAPGAGSGALDGNPGGGIIRIPHMASAAEQLELMKERTRQAYGSPERGTSPIVASAASAAARSLRRQAEDPSFGEDFFASHSASPAATGLLGMGGAAAGARHVGLEGRGLAAGGRALGSGGATVGAHGLQQLQQQQQQQQEGTQHGFLESARASWGRSPRPALYDPRPPAVLGLATHVPARVGGGTVGKKLGSSVHISRHGSVTVTRSPPQLVSNGGVHRRLGETSPPAKTAILAASVGGREQRVPFLSSSSSSSSSWGVGGEAKERDVTAVRDFAAGDAQLGENMRGLTGKVAMVASGGPRAAHEQQGYTQWGRGHVVSGVAASFDEVLDVQTFRYPGRGLIPSHPEDSALHSSVFQPRSTPLRSVIAMDLDDQTLAADVEATLSSTKLSFSAAAGGGLDRGGGGGGGHNRRLGETSPSAKASILAAASVAKGGSASQQQGGGRWKGWRRRKRRRRRWRRGKERPRTRLATLYSWRQGIRALAQQRIRRGERTLGRRCSGCKRTSMPWNVRQRPHAVKEGWVEEWMAMARNERAPKKEKRTSMSIRKPTSRPLIETTQAGKAGKAGQAGKAERWEPQGGSRLTHRCTCALFLQARAVAASAQEVRRGLRWQVYCLPSPRSMPRRRCKGGEGRGAAKKVTTPPLACLASSMNRRRERRERRGRR